MNSKKLSLIFTVFTLAVLCFSCSKQTKAQRSTDENSGNVRPTNYLSNFTPEKEINTSNWKTYKDKNNGFSFQYPPNLTLQKRKSGVRLFHTVDFEYQDPCDGRDNPPIQKKLVDFDLLIKIVNQNFQNWEREESVRAAEAKLGNANQSVEGKIISHGYDGCGYDEYVFPFGENRSFIMQRQIIGLFSPIYADFPGAKEARALPDLLENEAEIIKRILESVRHLKK